MFFLDGQGNRRLTSSPLSIADIGIISVAYSYTCDINSGADGSCDYTSFVS